MRTPEQYQELLKDIRWQSLRHKVLIRDKFTCIKCQRQSTYPDLPNYKRGLIMNVHHEKYIGKYPWDTPIKFLKTLCEDCHNIAHCNSDIQDFFKRFVSNSDKNML